MKKKTNKSVYLNLGKGKLSRRSFLRGFGTVMALPYMEAMLPGKSLLGQPGTASEGMLRPMRMAFVYHPNGVIMDAFTPKKTGRDFDFPQAIEALQPFAEHIQVHSGLEHDKARANGDGAGGHARANATFLTAAQAYKTGGTDIHLGVSVDQVAAEAIGHETVFPSLELSASNRRRSGTCDSGYSCIYQNNLSWRTPTTPMPPETNPKVVFDRLFSNNITSDADENREKRDLFNQSILDYVLEDAKALQKKLGAADRDKLDEYTTSVREIEKRIERAAQFSAKEFPDYQAPTGIPEDYREHLRLMYDMMVLAFQTDSSRITTFMQECDGSSRSFYQIGVSEGHHSLSHHAGEQEKIEKVKTIDRFYFDQFAYFLERLQTTADGPEGTLLDHCAIVYGGGLSDGNRHTNDNLPVILAGKGDGSLQSGRHVQHKGGVPMANLYLSLLDKMGVQANRFGDSTGKLRDI